MDDRRGDLGRETGIEPKKVCNFHPPEVIGFRPALTDAGTDLDSISTRRHNRNPRLKPSAYLGDCVWLIRGLLHRRHGQIESLSARRQREGLNALKCLPPTPYTLAPALTGQEKRDRNTCEGRRPTVFVAA